MYKAKDFRCLKPDTAKVILKICLTPEDFRCLKPETAKVITKICLTPKDFRCLKPDTATDTAVTTSG